MEVVAFAQTDEPQGMFNICLDFISEMAGKIRSMPIVHNSKVHKSLL